MKIDIPWKCPKCGGSLKPTSTHIRPGDKPDIYQRACRVCSFAMCWFEMKDGYTYTLDYKKDE